MPSEPFNWTITDFDDAILYAANMVGSDFDKAIRLCNSIIDNPSDYTGPQASITAMKLAAHRVKIGVAAQYWKQKSTNAKTPQDRLIKDALMCLYDGILELINTLKASARQEREILTYG